MKVSDMYTLTKAWMFEKPTSTIYDNYIVPITNKILAELYEQNNMCRMFYGKLPFIDGIEAHLVSNQNDEIDFEEEYVRDVIPKGIDANFLMDDDLTKMAIYQTEYNNAQVTHQKAVSIEKVNKLTEEAHNAS